MAVPRHLAIIMDGNGRWAKQRGRPRMIGHRVGARAVNLCIEHCLARGVEVLTLFAFSSENWGRPQDEVGALMRLFLSALEREVSHLHKQGVRLRFIGERSRFSDAICKQMQHAEQLTAANQRLHLNIAASYGGRQDISNAVQAIAAQVAAGTLAVDAIDETLISAHVALADLPAPDLFIRTGGEHRISNFLLWQLAYTELWFTDTLWPDLNTAVLERAFADYAGRERRFGLTSEQRHASGTQELK